MVNKLLIFGCISLILSGCTGSNKNKFDCPAAEGARCLPLGEIDARIDAGMQMNKKEDKAVFRKLEPLNKESGISGEEVVEIWFAPQVGEDGRYMRERRTAFSLAPSIAAGIPSAEKSSETTPPRKEVKND